MAEENTEVAANAEQATPKAAEPEDRDWVGETVKAFIEDAEGIDPTDPVAAVEQYFERNAGEELKAKCQAEGKDAKGCWRFIEAVARKALHGREGHIDPGVVYAIAMHWFQDVQKDWNKSKVPATPAKQAKSADKAAKDKPPKAQTKRKRGKRLEQMSFSFDLSEDSDSDSDGGKAS